MPTLPTGPATARYIIRAVGDAVPLSDFISSIRADPSIQIVDQIGPPDRPHTVVAAMSDERARLLAHSFSQSNQLMIEPDRPLSMNR